VILFTVALIMKAEHTLDFSSRINLAISLWTTRIMH